MNFHGGELADILWPTLLEHVGHEIECVRYIDSNHTCASCYGFDPTFCPFNPPWNVSVECVTCYVVIIDVDNPELGDDYVAV